VLVPVLTLALTLLAAWATVFVAYQGFLALHYLLTREPPGTPAAPRLRFAVVIPAHDEEVLLGTALASWQQVDYPPDLYTIFVIADNCTDRTADIAQGSGAVCLERREPASPGKGQALAWALGRLPLAEYDAVAFVDADCTVNVSFLAAMNDRLLAGARVVQGFDGVLNPDESMLTRLMHITNVMKNLLFMHAKDRLGLSVQLMGTGMCFASDTLRSLEWRAFSVGEDVEQSVHLARGGIRVRFEPRAVVYAQEASSLGQAYSQRIRWASSRMQLVGEGARLLRAGIRRQDLHLADAGISLLTPNYALLANVTVMGLLAAVVLSGGTGALMWWYGTLATAQVALLGAGVALSGLSLRGLGSVAFAPVFLAWKLVVDLVALVTLRRTRWTRTRRSPV
jgi:1,2-diacylglycerol 3-beta-glucosyltransferase